MAETVTEAELLRVEAERFRAGESLGRSAALARLFNFLVERSVAGAPISEFDIAQDVFHRSGVDSDDASVRVYVHRLRRKLDEFYARETPPADRRLVIPKGGYQLALSRPGEAGGPTPGRWITRISEPRVLLTVLGALVAVNIVVWIAVITFERTRDPVADARGTPVWREMTRADRQVLVVVGDYYIFGELDGRGEVGRLVREFGINSPLELDEHVMANPRLMNRYIDLDLHYLPIASATALASILPLFEERPGSNRTLRVIMSSDLTPEMLKDNDIVYIGYLSGLGILRNQAFAGSRFSIGDTYDELIDSVGRNTYVSEAGYQRLDTVHKDYGYFSSFRGPAGRQVTIIAGTRDIALARTAQAAVSRADLDAIAKRTHNARSFEALYQVEGMGRTNLSETLLIAQPRKAPGVIP